MMFFRKTLDGSGDFVDADGLRWSVSMARRVRSAAGVNVGYVPFASLEEALAAWGLSAIEMEVAG
jgi:hypothetical protein